MERVRSRRIATKMWMDRNFTGLSDPGPSAKVLWQYLISGPQTTNIPGVVLSGRAGMAEALGWPLRGVGNRELLAEGLGEALQEGLKKGSPEGLGEGFEEGLRKALNKGLFGISQKKVLMSLFRGFDDCVMEIEDRGMAVFDFENKLIWLPGSIYYNKPESPNVVKSWRYAWDKVPEGILQAAIYRGMEQYFQEIGGAFYIAFEDSFEAPSMELLNIYDKAFGKASGKALAKALCKAIAKGDKSYIIEASYNNIEVPPKTESVAPAESPQDGEPEESPSAQATVPPSEFEGTVEEKVSRGTPDEENQPSDSGGEPDNRIETEVVSGDMSTESTDEEDTSNEEPEIDMMEAVPEKVRGRVKGVFVKSEDRDWALEQSRQYFTNFFSMRGPKGIYPEPDSGDNWDRILWTSAEVIEQIVRLDKFEKEEVEAVLAFIIQDDFWSEVGIFPSSLRDAKDKNTKVTKFRTILMKHQAKTKTKTKSGFSED